MKYLNTNVYVTDEEGASQVFGPGDTLPDWAIEQITNPNVWSDDPTAAAPKVNSQGGNEQPNETGFGSGPFKGRSAGEIRGLANSLGLTDHNNKDEAIALLQAEGVSEES